MDRPGDACGACKAGGISGFIREIFYPSGIYCYEYIPGDIFMKKEKLELLMSVLILVAAYFLSRQSAAMVASMRAQKAEKSGFCVVVDAGHGGSDPGKVSADGVEEKDINLEVAFRLKRLLEASDVTVYMIRTEDEGLYTRGSSNKKAEDLKNRCAFIHEKQPDCVVSIHQNSYHEAYVKGAQTFYYTDSAEGKCLAEYIQEYLVSYVDPENHRVAKNNTSYYMLKKTDAPITIVECGFLSNPQEAALLVRPDYQEKVAWAVHMGILRYLNKK